MSNYALWNNNTNEIEFGPTSLPLWWVDSNGVRHDDFSLKSELELNSLDWYEVAEVYSGLDLSNMQFKEITNTTTELVDNKIHQNHVISWKPLEEIKE